MRNLQDIQDMSKGDYACQWEHYLSLAQIINLRKYKTGIEVGVAYANNAVYLLENTDIEFLTCVDPYKFYLAMPGFINQAEYDILYGYASGRLSQFPKRSRLLRNNSKDALYTIRLYEQSYDFVFLDGDHTFDNVLWEMYHYAQVISPGGILSGHDYDNIADVTRAVDQFATFLKQDVKLLDGHVWFFDL